MPRQNTTGPLSARLVIGQARSNIHKPCTPNRPQYFCSQPLRAPVDLIQGSRLAHARDTRRARGGHVSGVGRYRKRCSVFPFRFMERRQQTPSRHIHFHRRGNVCENLAVFNCRQGGLKEKKKKKKKNNPKRETRPS